MRGSRRQSRFIGWVAAGGMLLALPGCGNRSPGADSIRPSNAGPSQHETSGYSAAPAAESPSAAELSTGTPTLLGNAATNPACRLLSFDQVAGNAGLAVTAMRGLASDPAQHSESCTWYLESKSVQSSLVVQYRLYAQTPKDVAAYYRQVIDQGYGTAVPGVGDVAKINGHVLDVVFRRAEIHVTLLTHAEATAADQAATIQLARIVLTGIAQ